MDINDFLPFDKWIPKEDLIPETEYLCYARNFEYGVWDGTKFIYVRSKFGSTFLDTEFHWDDGAPYGTVKPLTAIKQTSTPRGLNNE